MWGEEGQGSGVELSPEAEAERSGLCPDKVEEARAELYREQAEKIRAELEAGERKGRIG